MAQPLEVSEVESCRHRLEQVRREVGRIYI
jgi:hypothetical protein